MGTVVLFDKPYCAFQTLETLSLVGGDAQLTTLVKPVMPRIIGRSVIETNAELARKIDRRLVVPAIATAKLQGGGRTTRTLC